MASTIKQVDDDTYVRTTDSLTPQGVGMYCTTCLGTVGSSIVSISITAALPDYMLGKVSRRSRAPRPIRSTTESEAHLFATSAALLQLLAHLRWYIGDITWVQCCLCR